MSSFSLTAQFEHRQAQLAQSSAGQAWKAIDSFRGRVLLLSIIIVLGIVYLILVNNSASSGFYLHDLETQVSQLEESHEKLLITKAELESPEYIEEMVEGDGFIATSTAEHVSSQDTAVALVQ